MGPDVRAFVLDRRDRPPGPAGRAQAAVISVSRPVARCGVARPSGPSEGPLGSPSRRVPFPPTPSGDTSAPYPRGRDAAAAARGGRPTRARADPLVTRPPLPGEPHSDRARADRPAERAERLHGMWIRRRRSRRPLRGLRCPRGRGRRPSPGGPVPDGSGPPDGHRFLRLTDVLMELRGMAATVASAEAGEDLTYVVDRLERLLVALASQFVVELVGEEEGTARDASSGWCGSPRCSRRRHAPSRLRRRRRAAGPCRGAHSSRRRPRRRPDGDHARSVPAPRRTRPSASAARV